jgi:hypothetical protein
VRYRRQQLAEAPLLVRRFAERLDDELPLAM